MIESKYLCTYDLFSSIPTLDGTKTVTQEIFDWNEIDEDLLKSRLVRNGQGIDAPEYGLSEKHILTRARGAGAGSDARQAAASPTNSTPHSLRPISG